MKKKLFAYYRISPTPRKNSPEKNQILFVREYSEKNDIEIVEEFKDILISGTTMDRMQFNNMLQRLNEVDGIIIFDVSRFGRDVKEAIPLFLNILNQNKSITLVKNNKTLDYSPDSNMSIWDLLVPVIEFFQSEEYVKNMKIRQKKGIERFIEEKGKWGPNVKKLDLKKYSNYRIDGLNKSSVCILLKISRSTLYRRLNDFYKEYDSLKESNISDEDLLQHFKLKPEQLALILSDIQE